MISLRQRHLTAGYSGGTKVFLSPLKRSSQLVTHSSVFSGEKPCLPIVEAVLAVTTRHFPGGKKACLSIAEAVLTTRHFSGGTNVFRSPLKLSLRFVTILVGRKRVSRSLKLSLQLVIFFLKAVRKQGRNSRGQRRTSSRTLNSKCEKQRTQRRRTRRSLLFFLAGKGVFRSLKPSLPSSSPCCPSLWRRHEHTRLG